MPAHVYHFSEDPYIPIFAPHRSATSTVDGAWVWACDAHRAPCYWFPRDCPRATFWPLDPDSLSPEADGLLAGATRVHAMQNDWLADMKRAKVFVYTFDGSSFQSTTDVFEADGHGFWVSQETLTPLDVSPLGDLIETHAEAGIELRMVNNLAAFWQRVIKTPGLDFSGIRLRNLRP